MFDLEAILPELMEMFSSIGESWGALGLTVVTAVLSKATGSVYRINEAKAESDFEYRYIRKREWESLFLVALATGLTQIVTFPLAKKLLSKWIPKQDKNIDALIRLALIAPGLFASESLSRLMAGRKKHEALEAFNDQVDKNWRRLINTAQSMPLKNLTSSNALPLLSSKALPKSVNTTPSSTTAKAGQAFNAVSTSTRTALPIEVLPINTPIQSTDNSMTVSPLLSQIAAPSATVSIYADSIHTGPTATGIDTSAQNVIKEGLAALPSPASFQPVSFARAMAPNTF